MPSEGLMPVGPRGTDFGLTPLDIQAIELIANGYSHYESTERLGFNPRDLRLQVEGICNKLSVSNQFELLLFALYYHLVDICVEPEPSESAQNFELTNLNVPPVHHK